MNIVFVCTGNTCRSPMAEGLMNKYSKQSGISAKCTSAGIMVIPNSFVSAHSVEAMKNYGIDISSHRPTQLTRDKVQNADLVLTMTASHSSCLKEALAGFSDKIFSLGEYTGTTDISDPYGQSIDTYKLCAEEIKKAVLILCERIKSNE